MLKVSICEDCGNGVLSNENKCQVCGKERTIEMSKTKGIRIEGFVFADKGELDQIEFSDAFVDFLESKGWEFGGSIKVVEEKEQN